VAFPPSYPHRGLTVKIKGERFKLDPLQEEMLMAWAKKKDTPYVQDPVFQQNFLGDLKQHLPERFADISLADVDWTELYAIADREKTANLPPEEKKKRSAERKALREELKAKFASAIVDGKETEIGAYLVEPPGILMGRGAHPLRGKWKRRVEPKDVTLNLDEHAPVPEGDWKEIVHDPDSMWIASWYDELSDKRKYIWLADSSHLRQERDKEKYLKAAKLETGLPRVREKIRAGMNFEDTRGRLLLERRQSKLRTAIQSLEAGILRANEAGDTETRKKLEDELASLRKDLERLDQRRQKIHAAEMKTRQIATVCYLIDRLAMRVGDEKDEDEADTVGASTLRVEHVHIRKDCIEFDFLGKDSVQWRKYLPLNSNEEIFVRNLEDFVHGKQPGEQIFDKIDSTHVNRFLSSALPGLTAKVFRTYHATTTVRRFLGKKRLKGDAQPFEKEYIAKLANLEAAIACNHKRTPPKNWEQSLANKETALKKMRAAKPRSDKARARLKERIEKARRQLDLAKATRDYNLGTSLKNYIDPRVYKAWGDHVGFDWKRLYTKTLQRKFAWVNLTRPKWNANAK
jgi:DNA topoisomerase-1